MKDPINLDASKQQELIIEEEKVIQNGLQYRIKDFGYLRIYFKKDGSVSIDTSQIKSTSESNILKALNLSVYTIDKSGWEEIKETIKMYSGQVFSVGKAEVAKVTGLTLIYDGNLLEILQLSSKVPKDILRKLEKNSQLPTDTLRILEFLRNVDEERALNITRKLCGCDEKAPDRALQRWLLAQKVVDPKYILPAVGSDEAGKGDLFGPIVVAAVYVGIKQYSELSKLGIRDSKSISDKRILQLAQDIRRVCPYAIRVIEPTNLKKGEMNRQLEEAHLECISQMIKQTNSLIAVFDDFGSKHLATAFTEPKIFGFKNGERNLAVACASVVARAEFLGYLQNLSERYNLSIPTGSGEKANKAARTFIDKFGKEEFRKIAKVNFSNARKLLSN